MLNLSANELDGMPAWSPLGKTGFPLLLPPHPIIAGCYNAEWRHKTKQGSRLFSWMGRNAQSNLIGSHIVRQTNGEV